MVLHRPKRNDAQRLSARAIGRHGLVRCVLVGTLLIGGCIPSSSKYPFQPDDAGNGLPDSADSDTGRSPDASGDAGCVPPSDAELCESLQAVCGAITQTDRCGTVRTVNCGTCTNGGVCTLQNTCCQQQNDNAFCGERAAVCGLLTATDNCGVLREEVACGSCPNPDDCTGTTCGTCDRESDMTFCARFGKECGEWSGVDNCGDSRNAIGCGSCRNGSECTSGVCVCPTGTVETICDDNQDNDCDGLIDCLDPDCDGKKCDVGLGGLAPVCREMECPAL